MLARIVGASVDHGEKPVADALEATLSSGRCDLLSLAEHLHDRKQRACVVEVPAALSGYYVEAAKASDYDRLLLGITEGGEA